MLAPWNIQRRASRCSATQREFADGEIFHTLLFRENDTLVRADLSEEAWQDRSSHPAPFCYWKSKFEKPVSEAEAPLVKEGVEELLRRLSLEDEPQTLDVRYILVLMLERKRLLRPVDEKPSDEGRLLVYEHTKTGEAFIVTDPMLRLDQVDTIQQEVFDLLTNSGRELESNSSPEVVDPG